MELKIKKMGEYIYNKKDVLLIYTLIAVLLFGTRWTGRNVSIDTVIFANEPKTFYNWLDIGRQGLVLTKILFSPFGYNPYWEGFLTCLAMIIMAVLLLYYLEEVMKASISKLSCVIMLGIIESGVVFSLQYFFFMQIFEIYFSIILTLGSLICIYQWIFKKNIYSCIAGILLMIWAFSSYQATVPLYILCGIVGYMFYEEDKISEHITMILKLVITFLIAFLINMIITKLFFNSSDYLDTMYAWKNGTALQNIKSHIEAVWTGKNGVIYNQHYKIIVIAYAIWALLNLKKIKLLKTLAAGMIILAPFYLTIYTGMHSVQRAQFNLLFCVAFSYMLLINKFSDLKLVKNILIVLSIVNILNQSYTTLKLFYTDDVRYQSDAQYAYQISESLKREGIEENTLPVVFIGKISAGSNNDCLEYDQDYSEYFGASIWGMNAGETPRYFWSTQLGSLFMQSLGIKYYNADETQVEEGRTIAKEMNCWPQENSIKVVNEEYVVVKLSEDEFEE